VQPKPAAPAPAKPVAGSVADFTPTRGTALQSKLNDIRSMLQGHTDRNEEKKIISIFKDAPAVELNQIMQGLTREEFHELASDMDDRLFGPDNKTAFMNLISKDRVGELSVESKARFVQALQHGPTGSVDEKAITNVFLSTRGDQLSQLKGAIDLGGDHRDLQQLVFHDIDSKELRNSLLQHFKTAASPKSDKVKVLSDIDDTFYANLKDDRYPKKTVYPGVRALYAELDKGPGATPDRTGDLMFLSARPYDRPGAVENGTRSMLQDQGVTQATVLSGDFAHIVGNELIAAKKFDNWKQVNQLYPEYGSVFIGDSGQGDAIFGANAVSAKEDMRAVFIHNVTGVDEAGKAEFAKKGVTVFDTYVGAATAAFEKGLITADGLQRVMSAATRELGEVHFDNAAQKAARQADLDRDIAAARAALS
jgi:hypothetical protein